MSLNFEKNWDLVTEGWTIRDNRNNIVGGGRPPGKSFTEAQEVADKFNNRQSINP